MLVSGHIFYTKAIEIVDSLCQSGGAYVVGRACLELEGSSAQVVPLKLTWPIISPPP